MALGSAPTNKTSKLTTVQWLAVALLAIAVIGVVVIIFRKRPPTVTTTNQTPVPVPVAVTPLHFTDFIGSVDTVSDTEINVNVPLIESNGQRRVRRYKVTIDAQTKMQTITITDSGTAVSPLTIRELQKDDRVQVFESEQNLYEVDAFTAKQLIKLVTS